MPYAFQIFSVFVASSNTFEPLHQQIVSNILSEGKNWGKDMKYLIPGMTKFLVACVHKFHTEMQSSVPQIQ